MTATFFRFVVALLSWMSLRLVVVAALAPEESTEFDGQKVTDFGLQARDGRTLMFVIPEACRQLSNSSPVGLRRVARSSSN
jgi:hypothetical protein